MTPFNIHAYLDCRGKTVTFNLQKGISVKKEAQKRLVQDLNPARRVQFSKTLTILLRFVSWDRNPKGLLSNLTTKTPLLFFTFF